MSQQPEPTNQEIISRPLPLFPRTNKLGEWLCPGCGQPDFRLTKEPIEHRKGAHLFSVRCANCRREAGTGFPC